MLDPAAPFNLLRKASAYRSFGLGLPILLYAWSVTGPFVFDDVVLVLKSERFESGEYPRLDLFRFAADAESWQERRSRGTFPWWSAQTHRIDFFRPVSEWSFYLDVKLFGRSPTAHRLVSLLLFAIALVCVHRLARMACDDISQAGVVTMLFGLSQTVAQPVAFISNRGDLFVIIGASIAAAAYWSAASRPRRHLVVVAGLGFALAALAKEPGAATAGVIVGHHLLRRLRGLRPNGVETAIACLIFAMGLAYVVFYLGTRASQFDMASAGAGPMAALQKAAVNGSLYAAVLAIGFPISVLLQAPTDQVLIVAGAGLATLLLAVPFIIRSNRQDRGAGFFAVWIAMFMLPALLVHPETRALSVVSIGWAYLLAGVLVPREGARPAPMWVRHWLFTTNGIVSICCAVGTVLTMTHYEKQAREKIDDYADGLNIKDGDAVFVQQASSPFELICGGDRLEFLHGHRDVSLVFLTAPDTNPTISREDDHTLLVQSDSPNLLDSQAHKIMLGPHWKPQLGYTFELRDFNAEIASLRDDGTVDAIRFKFKSPLSDPRLHLVPPL